MRNLSSFGIARPAVITATAFSWIVRKAASDKDGAGVMAAIGASRAWLTENQRARVAMGTFILICVDG